MNTPDTIKNQLAVNLGSNGRLYWNTLSGFVAGKIGRSEFERAIREWINTPELVSLHNNMLLAMLAEASIPTPSNTMSSTAPQPPRKRRRLLPHQDPPPRLKNWVVGMGKQERERVRSSAHAPPQPLWRDDEIGADRPVRLRPEGKNPAGTRVSLPLSTITRALPSYQNLTERITLIASQHQLTTSKPVISLLAAAIEAYLKQLSMHALSLTSAAHPFTSISPSGPVTLRPLSLQSFNTLLTLAPSDVPNPSAVAMKLHLSQGEEDVLEEPGEGSLDDPVGQLWSILGSRSGVKDQVARMI